MDNNEYFRKAERKDTALVLSFIKKIAAYEKMEDQVKVNLDTLEDELFNKKRAEVFFILHDGKEVGYCLYFFNFSTFEGHSGLYVEDIFIDKEYRGLGLGKKAFIQIAKIAKENNCPRIDWVCLDWNTPSQDFYKSLGASPLPEWLVFRLEKDNIDKLSKK